MQAGTTIGPYVVRRHLGDGGMGSVWLADDTRLRRQVALKTLQEARTTDSAGRERLMREARAAAALNHAHIATVHDVIEIDGDVAIVFEFVEGTTIATALLDGPWPIDRVLPVAMQLTKALVAAHALGVIHRDLKPSNVIVRPDGDIKVLDFGIARLLPLGSTVSMSGDTSSQGFVGTPAYAAPEQMLTPAVDERADLYALGVMLFEMTTGRRPFAGNDPVSLASAKLTGSVPTPSSTGALVPPEFDTLVTRLLAPQPDNRPASAAQVLTSLRAIIGDTPTALALPRGRRLARWWPATAIAALTAVLAAVLTVGWPRRSAMTEGGSPVVAVLPLRNTSGDQSKDYLAAGLSESLIAGLASSPSLVVLSRTAVADAVKAGANTGDAIRALNASYVIDGSLQQSERQLRVAINLVRADQSIAWGRTFDGTIDRIFDLQTQMALAVSEAMSAGRPSPSTGRAVSPTAQESYWRGRAFLDRWDVKGNIDAAIASFSEAIADDPNFALAHAGLGLGYWRKYSETRDQQFAKMSVDAGAKAASLEPNLPEVHYALAVSLAGTGQTDDAIRELHTALAQRPTFDDARRQLATILASGGKIDEAVAEYQKAIALRPKYWGNYNDLGGTLFAAGRHADAAKAYEQVVALQPDSYLGYQQLGAIYQTMGDPTKAIEAYRKSGTIRPSFGASSNLGTIYYANGDYTRAVEAYIEAIGLRPALATGYRNLGDAYLKLGRKEDAQRAFLTAVERAQADLSVNPNSARGIAALALYQVKAGRAAEGLSALARAIKLAPDDALVRYRAAVVNALAGRQQEALNHVAAAIDRGYSVRAIVEEEDLSSLRNHAEFQDLTKRKAER